LYRVFSTALLNFLCSEVVLEESLQDWGGGDECWKVGTHLYARTRAGGAVVEDGECITG
jgi:hypothetical protein